MTQWLLNSAKTIGLSHIDEKIPCQDSVKTLCKNGVSVAVLSDGCGSAHFAEFGSKIVVDKVSAYLIDNFDDIFSLDENEIKKVITKCILDNVDEFVKKNINVINNYFETEKGKRNYTKVSNYEIMRRLSKDDAQKLLYDTLFDATVLFVCIKDDKCLVGHCGDGFILGKQNDEFVVISEEPKLGERNETSYPSVAYYFSLGYESEKEWDVFRILKLNPNDYQGFTLMSDGAEKSLVKISGNVSTPLKSNNNLLYEIVANEKEEDATKYLTELLEQTYRERTTNDGDYVFLTDDDVSVALIVSANNVFNREDPKVNKDSELQVDKKMYFDDVLRKMLTIGDSFDDERFLWLHTIFSYLVDEYSKKAFDISYYKEILIKRFYVDEDDLEQIAYYGRRLNVISFEPFHIKFIGGASNEN